MKRHIFELSFSDEALLKNNLLSLASKAAYSTFLDTNKHQDSFGKYDWLVALNAHDTLKPLSNSFDALKQFHEAHQDWLFGHLSYELKNEVETLSSKNPENIGFHPLLFFVPETVVHCSKGKVTVESLIYDNEHDFKNSLNNIESFPEDSSSIELEPQTSHEEYLNHIKSLHEQLQFGNIYEVNYCIEFSQYVAEFNPMYRFSKLNATAQAPFSAFYKNNGLHLLCASPERYLVKRGSKLRSQPIKGTIKREADEADDLRQRQELSESEKERSENVMITDLVRNDLSRTATKGSVKVSELFGIYTFNTLHQMISTVESQLDPKYHFSDVLETSFPMGSMTGAPKVKAMEIIEEQEVFARNLYSGSVGYITPNGDFDFNVIIRSLLYDAHTGYLSARVGSAITIKSKAKMEYEECLLKATNLFNSLK